MKANEIKLTDLEKELLRCWNEENTFCSEVSTWEDSTFCFAVHDEWKKQGNDPKQLSGVMSSLVKKGVIVVSDHSKEPLPEDRNDTCWFTPEGAELMEDLYNRFGVKKEDELLTSTNGMHVHHYLEDDDGEEGHYIKIVSAGQEVRIDCINKESAEKLFNLLAEQSDYNIR